METRNFSRIVYDALFNTSFKVSKKFEKFLKSNKNTRNYFKDIGVSELFYRVVGMAGGIIEFNFYITKEEAVSKKNAVTYFRIEQELVADYVFKDVISLDLQGIETYSALPHDLSYDNLYLNLDLTKGTIFCPTIAEYCKNNLKDIYLSLVPVSLGHRGFFTFVLANNIRETPYTIQLINGVGKSELLASEKVTDIKQPQKCTVLEVNPFYIVLSNLIPEMGYDPTLPNFFVNQ